MKAGFIGAGNIARALIGGLIQARPDSQIWVSDPIPAQLAAIQATVSAGIQTTDDNSKVVSMSDVVVLCVKPDRMSDTCSAIRGDADNKVFISVAAGITSAQLQEWLGPAATVIRSMPNTPALIGLGMTGLFAASEVNQQTRDVATDLLATVGKTLWFEQEHQLDAVTAVSGSGPAYFFLLIEALQNAATDLGLTREQAEILANQTALGAATMAINSELAISQLRENVTSPGGTTAAALGVMAEEDLRGIITRAVRSANQRAKELSGS